MNITSTKPTGNKPRRKKPKFRRKYKNKSEYLARKALREVKNLKIRNPKPETKHLTIQGTSASVSTSSTIVSLLSMGSGQGLTTNTRIGDEITTTSILLNYIWAINTAATRTQVRTMLVTDNKPAGAAASLAEMLHDSTSGDNIISSLNHTYRKRFWAIYDKTHQMSDAGEQTVQAHFYMPLKRKIVYSGTVGDETDLDDYNVYLVLISTEATNQPTCTYFCQVRYRDS